MQCILIEPAKSLLPLFYSQLYVAVYNGPEPTQTDGLNRSMIVDTVS